MHKLTTIYKQVDDPDLLDQFFSSTHLPLAEQLPGLLKSEVSRITHKPGGQSRFFMMYELYFESGEVLQDAFASPIGLQLIQALQPWAKAKIITWFYADIFEEEAGLWRTPYESEEEE